MQHLAPVFWISGNGTASRETEAWLRKEFAQKKGLGSLVQFLNVIDWDGDYSPGRLVKAYVSTIIVYTLK